MLRTIRALILALILPARAPAPIPAARIALATRSPLESREAAHWTGGGRQPQR